MQMTLLSFIGQKVLMSCRLHYNMYAIHIILGEVELIQLKFKQDEVHVSWPQAVISTPLTRLPKSQW